MTQEQFSSKHKKINERIFIGLIVIVVGVLILLRNLNFPFPDFLFKWPMILILIGVITGIRDRFKTNSWWILIGLGTFFLLRNVIFPDYNLRTFFWPAILIAVGLSFVLGKHGGMIRRRGNFLSMGNEEKDDVQTPLTNKGDAASSAEEVIDTAAVFGSVKKKVYSKNLRGGEVVNVFGGSEIDLTNADFTGEIKLEVVNIFGGTTLIVPPHWQIKSETAAVFGGIEDKRPQTAGVATDKVLVLDGFVMMGGIDIKS
jgi:predicted membrane protein